MEDQWHFIQNLGTTGTDLNIDTPNVEATFILYFKYYSFDNYFKLLNNIKYY